MISLEKLNSMLFLQNALNCKIHPEWHLQKFPWTDAIMVEGTEALEHYGWKWWKKQTPDMPQVRIELVDIWHFGLSIYLERNGGDVGQASKHMMEQMEFWGDVPSPLNMRQALRGLIHSAAGGHGHFNIGAFTILMKNAELSWDDLYTTYVAKNVLNTFRQDNGYKAGTYIKEWHGQEDNVVLANVMSTEPNASPGQLYDKLGFFYAGVVAQSQ